MNALEAVNTTQEVGKAQRPVRQRRVRLGFNWYPVLGLLLTILMASLTYGGIYILIDE